MSGHSSGFEEDEQLRSNFVRDITLRQIASPASANVGEYEAIPRTLVRFWHEKANVPDDVQACLDSWLRLKHDGFSIWMFHDESATEYISSYYGERELAAFRRCHHPAMRSDYFRLCFILAEGGMYVDADDVLLTDGWVRLFENNRLKVQPLCYDIKAQGMVRSSDIWTVNLPTENRIFYVNNDPIISPAGHALLRLALNRATDKLLSSAEKPEIQSTTGPGNLTSVLAEHANRLSVMAAPFDFELIRDWDDICETRWNLSYRNDARNWRLMNSH